LLNKVEKACAIETVGGYDLELLIRKEFCRIFLLDYLRKKPISVLVKIITNFKSGL
jgi:hypothetical protein